MISLAMDTAGSACAACIYDSGQDRILAEVSETIGKGHAERLMGIISEVLSDAGVSYHDIGKIVTTIGPGSFTGIRVSVATARGFGLGLGIPVVGVTNLEAIIAGAREAMTPDTGASVCAVMYAGRDQVYAQCDFDTELAASGIPFLASVDEIVKALNQQMDKAADKELVICGNQAEETGKLLEIPPVTIAAPDGAPIGLIARIGAEREENGKKPEPLYIRRPDAKPQAGFAVERTS